MLLTQIFLMLSIAAFGHFEPTTAVWSIAYLAFAVAFFSASQDVVIDAYRREILADNQLGLGSSMHVNFYRVAGLIPGSLALILADHMDWTSVFYITALFMLVGIVMTLCIKEPNVAERPKTISEAVVAPFQEFVGRKGWHGALLILSFMFLYKLGDNMATALATPFYQDLGFTLTQIGLIAKNAALWPAIFGGIVGGLMMVKIGINRALWIFGVVQLLSILGFAVLAELGPNTTALAIVIGFEYLGVGLGTAAFTALSHAPHTQNIPPHNLLFLLRLLQSHAPLLMPVLASLLKVLVGRISFFCVPS